MRGKLKVVLPEILGPNPTVEALGLRASEAKSQSPELKIRNLHRRSLIIHIVST